MTPEVLTRMTLTINDKQKFHLDCMYYPFLMHIIINIPNLLLQ